MFTYDVDGKSRLLLLYLTVQCTIICLVGKETVKDVVLLCSAHVLGLCLSPLYLLSHDRFPQVTL